MKSIFERRRCKKKGSLFDIPFILIFCTILFIIILILYTIFASLVPRLKTGLNGPIETNRTLDNILTVYKTYDYTIPFVLYGMFLASVVGAFLLRSHPVMMWALIMVAIVMLLIAVIYSNMIEKFTGAATDINVTAAPNFSKTAWTYSKLPYIVAVMSMIIIIIIISKRDEVNFR